MSDAFDPFWSPHAEAAQMLADGRPLQAAYILEEAIKAEPHNLALRKHLARLAATPNPASLATKGPTFKVGFAYSAVYLLMPWIHLLGSFAICFSVAFYLARFAGMLDHAPINQSSGVVLLTLLFGVVVVGSIVILSAWQLFLFFWFKFLRLLPASHALKADRCIASVMQVSTFGTKYWRMRKNFFAEQYGA